MPRPKSPKIDRQARSAVRYMIEQLGGPGPAGPTGPAGPATTDASLLTSGTLPDGRFPATLPAVSGVNLTNLNASALASGTVALARLAGITDAEIAVAAAIAWSKVSKAGSSLADLATRSAADLASGTLAKARMHADYPDRTVAEAIAGVWDFSNGLKERGRGFKMGEWSFPAFNAGDFTADAGTWTVASGNVFAYAWTIVSGKTMVIAFTIGGAAVSATPTDVKIKIPGGFSCANRIDSMALGTDTGGFAGAIQLYAISGGTVINARKVTGTWATGNISVFGQIQIEVS